MAPYLKAELGQRSLSSHFLSNDSCCKAELGCPSHDNFILLAANQTPRCEQIAMFQHDGWNQLKAERITEAEHV